jgi:hypothetical protein
MPHAAPFPCPCRFSLPYPFGTGHARASTGASTWAAIAVGAVSSGTTSMLLVEAVIFNVDHVVRRGTRCAKSGAVLVDDLALQHFAPRVGVGTGTGAGAA